MKVLFLGDFWFNGGPTNVNKGLRQYLSDRYIYLSTNNKILKILQTIYYTVFSSKVIYSGIMNVGLFSIIVSKILRKKNAYLMHGCIEYETKINKTTNKLGMIIEKMHWEIADKIICVSDPFAEWFKSNYPKYKDKVVVVCNGVKWDEHDLLDISNQRKNNLIVVTGGDRLTKNNIAVCEAVKLLNNDYGYNFELFIFGNLNKKDSENEYNNFEFVEWKGLVERKELFEYFKKSNIYIQNSSFEPFGLSPIEALLCGCNLIVSSNVGALTIIDSIQKEDIIYDTKNIREIADKILNVYRMNNNERLLNSIDKNKTTYKARAKELERIIEGL